MSLPRAKAYSPLTKITSIDASEVVIDDTEGEGIGAFLDATVDEPGEAVLCADKNYKSEDPDDYETIRYTGRNVEETKLTGVTRNVEGLEQSWASGTYIRSVLSAESWNDLLGVLDEKLNKSGDTLEDYVENLESSTGTGTVTLNLANSNVFEHTVDADTTTTIGLANVRAGAHSFTLALDQHAGEPTITWNFTVEWPNDTPPDILGGMNILTFITFDGGTKWYGHLAGQSYGDGAE